MTREEAKVFLTPKEFEVWELREQGLTPKEIAAKNSMDVKYVHHLSRSIDARIRSGHKRKSATWVRLEEKLQTPVTSMELAVCYGDGKMALLKLTPKQYKGVIRGIGVEEFDQLIATYEKEVGTEPTE